MIEQLRWGKLKYISFIVLDLVCLFAANQAAFIIYERWIAENYTYKDYQPIILLMLGIDLFVTVVLNTLNRVLRRRKRKELLIAAKHMGISFLLLAAILFSLRQGSVYSRITVYLTYVIYFILFVLTHIIWRNILKLFRRRNDYTSVMLMTTDRFVQEGLDALRNDGKVVKYVFLLKNVNRVTAKGIPVVKDADEAAAAMCWKWIDKAYVYGIDHHLIPNVLQKACWDMGLSLKTVDFEYKVIELKTIPNEDPKYGALSFLEGQRDIPFPIRRVYWITETEANLHRGFHAHKLNCQLLFCPYGEIDILLDNGKEKTSVTLKGPDRGLILMPGMWREMVWKKTGSILCVLASEYYDPNEYIRNYDEFMKFRDKTGSRISAGS